MASYGDKQARPAIAEWRICSGCGQLMKNAVSKGEEVLVCGTCMRVVTKQGQKKRLRELRFNTRYQGEGNE